MTVAKYNAVKKMFVDEGPMPALLYTNNIYGKMAGSENIKGVGVDNTSDNKDWENSAFYTGPWTTQPAPNGAIWVGAGSDTKLPEIKPDPNYDVEQLLLMAQLSKVPSLERAVNELAVVIKRIIEKNKLGPIAALALIRMIENNTFTALISAVNEVYKPEDGDDDEDDGSG